eukprot:5451822-Pyramimonas_sp.AAC.1
MRGHRMRICICVKRLHPIDICSGGGGNPGLRCVQSPHACPQRPDACRYRSSQAERCALWHRSAVGCCDCDAHGGRGGGPGRQK